MSGLRGFEEDEFFLNLLNEQNIWDLALLAVDVSSRKCCARIYHLLSIACEYECRRRSQNGSVFLLAVLDTVDC